MKINNDFIDKKGFVHPKVLEKAFDGNEKLDFGKFVNETGKKSNSFLGSNGVYIYQDYDDSSVAYRIYDEYADYNFNGYNDVKIIEEFNKRKDKIKLTKFPYGVVTVKRCIIGQIIPYFVNSITLMDYIDKNKGINIFRIYRKIIEILKELVDNDITYVDVHSKNFLIGKYGKINLIDFDDSFLDFSNISSKYESMIHNLVHMISKCNTSIYGDTYIDNYSQLRDLKDVEDKVIQLEKKLIK